MEKTDQFAQPILLPEKELHSRLLRQISYSSLNEFRSCERRFYLDKLTAGSRDNTVDTAFGSAVGAGVQTLWKSGDYEKARAATFFAWSVDFEDRNDKKKKSLAYALKAVEAYFPFYEILSREWKLAVINGRPAVEFSLVVEFPSGFRYRSFVDLILQDLEETTYCITELKTTGFSWQHEAQYKNSEQGVSYILPIDQLDPKATNYWIKYFAYYTQSMQWVPYDFPKTLIDKARWIRSTLIDIKAIQEREKENYWPMRGKSCFDFGRPCRYFETCSLPDAALLASPLLLQEKIERDEGAKRDFTVSLEKVVENYLESENKGE